MTVLRRLLVPAATTISLLTGVFALVRTGPPGLEVREAHAKSGYESRYTFDQTWNTAVRLVRVDMGFKIVEKDEKTGYILFEYVDKGTTSSASLELLPGERIRVICQIPKFPSYHESALLDRLAKKLKEDHGAPVEKPKPAPDAGPTPGDASDAAP